MTADDFMGRRFVVTRDCIRIQQPYLTRISAATDVSPPFKQNEE